MNACIHSHACSSMYAASAVCNLLSEKQKAWKILHSAPLLLLHAHCLIYMSHCVILFHLAISLLKCHCFRCIYYCIFDLFFKIFQPVLFTFRTNKQMANWKIYAMHIDVRVLCIDMYNLLKMKILFIKMCPTERKPHGKNKNKQTFPVREKIIMFFNKHISFTCCFSQTPAMFISLCICVTRWSHQHSLCSENPIFYKIEKRRESMALNWIFNGFGSVVCVCVCARFFAFVRSCFPVVYLLLYAKWLDRASQNGVLYCVRKACVRV